MKITLEREIRLNKAEAVLSIKREVLRPDIQDYLNGSGYGDKMLDNGIRNYLKSVGIYDENFNLTKYGSDVKDTGVFNVKEKGKYRIRIDGQRIVFVERIAPEEHYSRGPNIDALVLAEDGHFCLPFGNDEEFYRFEIEKLNKSIYGSKLEGIDTIKETIEITDDNKSKTTFEGTITNDKQKRTVNKTVNENIEFGDVSLYNMAKNIFSELWNVNTNRLKIQLNALNDAADIESFETSYPDSWKSYKIQMERMPIEPYNIEEAAKWRNILINKEIAKQYLNEDDFSSLVRETNGKDGFAAYQSRLDIPRIENHIKEETKKYAKEYWHLQAPLDLCPDVPREMIIDKFILSQGESCSLRQIQEKIENGKTDAVFYYDKYVIKKTQQRIAGNLVDSFDSNRKYIITNLSDENRKSRYIASQKKAIKEVDIKNIFNNPKKAQHDRYLIFAVGEEISVWSITNSADYIDFQEHEFDVDSVGKVNTGVTFTKVNVKILNKELKDYIFKEIKNV